MPHELILAKEHSRPRSLGWLAIRWIEHFCVHGPGDIEGRPLSLARGPEAIPLTDELARHLVDTYALDENGRRLYDSDFYSRPKGANKSGFAAWVACFEALGPCRFGGWAEGGERFEWLDFRHVYEAGEPMGRLVPYPFLRILATEEGQTGNVYDAVYFNLRLGPLREAFPREDDIGLTRVLLPESGEIVPSTASSSAKDGGKETWVNFDETHLYVTPELRRMYATVRRNMAKRREAEPWSFETSTMYAPGQESVAEHSHQLAQRIRQGKVRRSRLLFDHREAPPDTDLSDEASLRKGLAEAYGDASAWLDYERLVSEIWDPRNDVSDSRRYFLNQLTAAQDAWVRPDQIDSIVDAGHVVPDGAEITVGFDGSRADDNTAAVGCEVSTGHLFTLGIWDPAEYGGEIPRQAVRGAIGQAFGRFDVVGFYGDLYPWESEHAAWEEEYGGQLCVSASPKHKTGWDMRGRGRETTQMIEALQAAVESGDVTIDGHPQLRLHFIQARRRPNQYGVSVGKESRESRKKIDAVPAAALARQARRDYLALPEKRRRRKRTGKAVFV